MSIGHVRQNQAVDVLTERHGAEGYDQRSTAIYALVAPGGATYADNRCARRGAKSFLAHKYGYLDKETWREDIRKGIRGMLPRSQAKQHARLQVERVPYPAEENIGTSAGATAFRPAWW
ncbi:MAG: hypothetical protein WAL59_19595, partial [Roseiarcus sp.]